MWALRLVLLAAVGCGDTGRVALHLDVPEDDALDPFALPVAELTLEAAAAGEIVFKESRAFPGPGETLEFGRLPFGDAMTFELSGMTLADRVVAFGRSTTPADVADGDEIDVALTVRRPFVYVAGAEQLAAVDGSGEPGQAYASAIDLGAAVAAVAATPDGRHVVAVRGTELSIVATSDHRPVEHDPVAVSADARKLAISPDGRTAVATHAEPPGVSIIDLEAALAGDAVEAVFVPTSAPASVAVADDRAWIVIDPPTFFCGGESSIVEIDLAAQTALPPLGLGVAAGDLAYEPLSDTVFIASGCTDSVLALTDGAVGPSPLPSVPGASALGVARGQLWAMGHLDGDDAHLILASVPLEGGEPDVLDFPPLEDRALATALSETGQDALIRMTPDLASAVDLTVMPDGEHVGILVAAISITTPTGDAGDGQFIIPEVRMITFEYQLAQLDTGLAAQRLRTSCEIEWEPGALLDDFECGLAPGQDELSIDFVPTGVSALYGSR